MAMADLVREQRRGKFTASQFYRLMGGSAGYVTCEFTSAHTCYERVKIGDSFEYVPMQEAHKTKKCWKRDDSFLPSGADTYIIEKVAELRDSERAESYTSFAMQYGIDTEPMAIAAVEAKRGLTLDHTGDNQVFFSDDNSGATPDGVEYKDGSFNIAATHDVKCPTAHIHTFNCLKVITASDLEAYYPVYFWQVIGQLLHTGANVGFWHSYRRYHESRELHTVIVERDDDKINALKHRIILATERKNSYISQLSH